MATKKSSSRTTNDSSLWIVVAVVLAFLLVWSLISNITRVDVGTVQNDLANLQAQLTAQAMVTDAPQATEPPAATEAPAEVTEAPAQPQNSCDIAANLGPWAPGGIGETFEVTCNETNCAGTHVQLWWPAGSHQDWDKKEISVLIPAGLSVEVQKGAGKGWEYPLGCSLTEIQSQIAADNGRRTTDTSFYGQVDIDDLIATGLVVVRYDRRAANPTP